MGKKKRFYVKNVNKIKLTELYTEVQTTQNYV